MVVVECYPGVLEADVRNELVRELSPALVVGAADALLSAARIETLVAPFLGGNDPVFGFLSGLLLPQFFDDDRLRHLCGQVEG